MKLSPLDAEHRALGAKMTPFGGWMMPLQYTSVLDEHRACRQAAVVFDVSHLGTLEVSGSGAFDALQNRLTNDLRRIAPGRAQYTHLLDPIDAHVVDDIIIWWVAEDRFLVMPNASNTDRVVAALVDANGAGDISAVDITETRGLLALQGPKAKEFAAQIAPEFGRIGRFRVATTTWHGHDVVLAGTGYTGEDGLEVQIAAAGAVELWEAAVAAGFVPAGLGARDTLRLEAGLPLHGHDLGAGITPLQAGLEWVVGWETDFVGKQALAAERDHGVARRLIGITVEGRQPPRADYDVVRDGKTVGFVSSGNYSPELGCGIALAFVDADTAELGEAASLAINARGKLLPAQRVALPFVRRA
jgi:aminomethyltransferase